MPLVLAPEIVAFGILAICLFLYACRAAWVSTFGALLESLARMFDGAKVGFRVFGHGFSIGFQFVGSFLRSLNRTALRLLGEGIDATQHAGLALFHWTAYYIEAIGRTMGDAFESVVQDVVYFNRWALAETIKHALHPLASKVEWLIHYVAHIAAHPATIVRPVTRIIDPRVKQLEAQVKQLAQAVANVGAIPTPAIPHVTIPSLPGIRSGIDALRHGLGRVTRILTPAGIVGLVAAGLAALKLGWLKCGNVRRVGEHVCGMDGDALESLLLGTVAVFGTVSLVEFAREMEGLMDEITPAVARFWQA
jgi:hypothetical protein